MKQAIIIGTTPDAAGEIWMADLRASLSGAGYPVVALQTWGFELECIGRAAETWDEFVFLPRSTVIKDPAFFALVFEEYRGRSVNLGTAQGLRFRMYLGKYRAEAVRRLGVPLVASKAEAVRQEVEWCCAYAAAEPDLADVGGPLEHSDVFEQRHGRLNMRVENEYLIRWKGTWDASMVQERGATA